ncbi:MAG TPA: VRR-NUC domain-containing protein [Longimicrobiaceae bacterium]
MSTRRAPSAKARRMLDRQYKEHDEQAAVIRWAMLRSLAIPELALLHAIPNGGHRSRVAAARLKAEGVKAGVPDLALPVPRGPYHGLYIEMKTRYGRPSVEQNWWLNRLCEQGYRAVVCRGFEEARAEIESYLALRVAA